MEIYLGNLFSFIATIFLFLAISRKDNYMLIKLQGISHFFFAIGGIILKGYSGAIQDSVGFIRNLVIVYKLNNYIIKALLLFTSVIMGFLFNNLGILGVLPIIGTFQYTIIATLKNVSYFELQVSIIINSILMVVYSLIIFNFVNVGTNIIVIIISLINLKKGYGFIVHHKIS